MVGYGNMVALVQMVRTLDCDSSSRRFESDMPPNKKMNTLQKNTLFDLVFPIKSSII